MDAEVHIIDYDNVIQKIIYLESLIDPLKIKIEINLKDEELLFAFKLGGFENYEKAVSKITKLSVMWKKSAVFYEMRRQILQNFSDEIDLAECLKNLEELSAALYSNKIKVKKDEEIVTKMTEIVEDDLRVFREFLEITNQVIESSIPLEEGLKSKVLLFLDSKKLEQACKNILGFYYHKKT